MGKTEFIARVILPANGQILLTQKKGGDYYYLPGGHIEYAEKAKDALQREAQEEYGGSVEIHQFVMAMEHSFLDNAQRKHHEINLIFLGKMLQNPFPQPPISREDGLVFSWHPIEALNQINLVPAGTAALVQELYEMGQVTPWVSVFSE